MTRKRQDRGRNASDAGQDDIELWNRLAKTIEPLRHAKPRVPTHGSVAAGLQRAPASKTLTSAPEAAARAAATPSREVQHNRKETAPAPPLAQFEHRKSRRVAGEQVAIEARLDLHGLRRSEAHRRLHAFLLEAQANGLRMVLVITGKGSPRDRAGDREPAWGEEERGTIRRHVPIWLGDAVLRTVVVSFTAAHARHGGAGALYVQLRRRRTR